MDGIFLELAPQLIGGPATNILTNSTTLPLSRMDDPAQTEATLMIQNLGSGGVVAFVALGDAADIALNQATALPIVPGRPVKVVLPAGYDYAAVQLGSGTATVSFTQVLG